MSILEAQVGKLYYMERLLVYIIATDGEFTDTYSSVDGMQWNEHEWDKPYPVVECSSLYE